jgi:hypothetical protein
MYIHVKGENWILFALDEMREGVELMNESGRM